MKQNIKNIIKKKYTIKKNSKKILKKKILKSIIQNNSLIIIKKNFFKKLFLKNFFWKYNKKKICNLTGRNKGVLKTFNISRHCLKQFNTLSFLQNIKIDAW